MVRHRKPPTQTWRTFLENHISQLVSVDFFTVPSIRFQVLYVFLVVAHERRRILHFNVTAHPTAEWTAQQLRKAFPWESAPRYLLRDRDRIFGVKFNKQVQDMGIEQLLSAPRSPWQRAYVERIIGTVRRECLDHVIMFGEAALYRRMKSFAEYYHRSRTHLSLVKDSPEPRAVESPKLGRIVAIPQVGDLHHRYERRGRSSRREPRRCLIENGTGNVRSTLDEPQAFVVPTGGAYFFVPWSGPNYRPRLGGPRLLVGLNNDPDGPHTIQVATTFGPNARIHDYTGHAADASTDGGGNVTITIPRNDNGLGYVCYSIEGQAGGFDINTRPVTQDVKGAPDLDVLPAIAGKRVQATRVWCAANSPVKAQLKPIKTDWTNATSILLELSAPDDSVLASHPFTQQTAPGTELQATTSAEGFHVFNLTSSNTPASNPNPGYTLSVVYTAPATLDQQKVALFEAAATVAADPAEVGEWSPRIPLANVPIHTHVLPTGKVLFWGRRNPPGTPDFPSLNQHATHSFIWDPANPNVAAKPTSNQPTDSKGNGINLFCSGHTFLADGRLLVTGGHIFDSLGLNTSTFYDPVKDQWSAGPTMNNGRWYPTAVTLPDGRAFVCSGSFPTGPQPLQPPPNNPNSTNNISQVLENGTWNDLTNFTGLPLFPRFHVAPNDDLFMSGSLATSYFFENVGHGNRGTWVPIATRSVNNADYAPSVMYDVGKVVFIGGGGGGGGVLPSNIVETIDLNTPKPAWAVAAPMNFHRRQHNATLLPDGTVLVTGGCQASGFDSLAPGQTVHTAELWDPHSGTWTKMAPEAVDRCYHSTAVLLPDGRVFSGGGGEYAPNPEVQQSNPSINTHADAQLFSPPYLFKGARPVITTAPAKVEYGQTFDVETPAPNEIGQVSWIRLPSVTHSFDQNQRINFLAFRIGANKVTVTAPANGNVCPPGHYMLFLLNQKKVPSKAVIIQIAAAAVPLAAGIVTTKASIAAFPL